MSGWDTGSSDEVELSKQVLTPTMLRLGSLEIETTYLGGNHTGQATWILWNAKEPHLIGLLRKSELGYVFEQTTSQGVMVHRDVSFNRVRRALETGR